jgi:hypothetical protein
MPTTDTLKPSDDAGQPSEGLAPKYGSLTVEQMADELGLDLCTFQGEGCDTCQEPKPDARIYVQMLQFAESNPEAGYYVCEHCLPEKHRVEKQLEADCIEWAEAEAAAMMAEESGNK